MSEIYDGVNKLLRRLQSALVRSKTNSGLRLDLDSSLLPFKVLECAVILERPKNKV